MDVQRFPIRLGAMLFFGLLAGQVFAWQLQPIPPGERAEQVEVVLVGRATEILQRVPSLISGTGDSLKVQVQVQVERRFKGETGPEIVVEFSEVAVEQPPVEMGQLRLWFLNKLPDGTYKAPAHFGSVAIAD